MGIKQKKQGSAKAESMKKVNIKELIKILKRFLTSRKTVLFTLMFISTIILLKTFLEVQATTYLGEIGEAISTTDGKERILNYKKYLLVTLVYVTLYSITLWISIPLIRKVFTELGIEQIKKIFKLSHQDFKKVEIAYYISNLNRCANAVSEFLETLFIKFFNTIAILMFSAYKLYLIFGIRISLVFLLVMFLFMIFTYYFTIIRIKYHIRSIESENFLQNQLLEKLENRDTVLMLDMFDNETENFKRDFRTYQTNTISFARSLPILNFCQDIIFYSFYFILMFYMISNENKTFQKKHFITSFTLLINVKVHISFLGWIFQLLYKTAANVTAGYLLLKIELEKGLNCKEIKEIEFCGFSKGKSTKIFDQISLKIDKPGSYVIVGPNGAGKSTFIKSLMGFYNNRKGISINNTPLDNLNIKTFQKRIVYANQDCQLFSGTILYNLQYGNNKSFQEIVSLCKELEIEDFILSKPEGYTYEIGLKGSNLSGGEKQKLVIARSILRNADVYIFDEPTANIDEKSEYLLLKKTNLLLRNKTVFYIIHNLKLVPLFDYVIFINNKKVSNPKVFEELIEMNNEFSNFIRSRAYKFES